MVQQKNKEPQAFISTLIGKNVEDGCSTFDIYIQFILIHEHNNFNPH